MRRRFLIGLGVLALVAAPTAFAVDVYIFGKVLGRVPGKNLGRVEVSWAYKCLGDKLGAATYEWDLYALRTEPKPATKKFLQRGTSKTGKLETTLAPGRYQLLADPFLCETERGAGSDRPEAGQTVVVPDYCGWIVAATRGQIELEQGTSVRLAKKGDLFVTGAALGTPKGGFATLASPGRDAEAVVAAGSRVEVAACPGTGGWKLSLDEGSVTALVKPGAAAKAYVVQTANASATGGVARWKVDHAGAGGAPTTKVKVLSGSVTVAGRKGKVVLRAGFSTTVKGTAAPTTPARG